MTEAGPVGSEEAIVQGFLAPLARGFAGALGLTDDCAFIGVEPGHRGLGVGRALLESVASAAGEAGYSRLSLSVEDDNPALRLYERVGFERRAHSSGAWTLVLTLD